VKIRTWNFLKEWYQNCWWSSAQISQKLSKFNVPKVILVLVILMIIKKSFVCSSSSCVVNWQWVYCKTCNLGQHWLIMGQTFMICNQGQVMGQTAMTCTFRIGLVWFFMGHVLHCPVLMGQSLLTVPVSNFVGQTSPNLYHLHGSNLMTCTSLQLCGCL